MSFEDEVDVGCVAARAAGEDEVGLAGRDFVAAPGKLGREAGALGSDRLPAFLRVGLILERRGRGENCDGVAVVTILHLHHFGDNGRRGDGVAETQTRK